MSSWHLGSWKKHYFSLFRMESQVTSGWRGRQLVQRSLHLRLTTLKLRWFRVTINRYIVRILMAIHLGVRQSSRWHKGWIRGDAKWIPEVPQKTHLCAPTRDHRFGRTGFDQSNNSQSNVERTWKTLHRRKMSAHALLKMTRALFRAMSLALRQKCRLRWKR